MANIPKDVMHQCKKDVIKSVIDPKLVSFKRVELGANSTTKFYGIKDGKGNDMFWVVLLNEGSGFSRGYVNIMKKGNDPAKKQEAMVNAWKKVRKSLSTKKAGVALVDPDIPNTENPFPLTAKLVTEEKSKAAANTPLGNLNDAVYNAFITNKPEALEYAPTTATNPEYAHQFEVALPHKTLWEYVYPSSLRESPTGETPDLLKVLTADLKDSCFILRLTGVTVKSETDLDGNDVSVVKVCMKVHHIVEIPNLGAFLKVKKPAAPQDTFSGASFDSLTNGMSGSAFYNEMVDAKGPASNVRTPTKKEKVAKKALVDGVVDDSATTKIKKPRVKKTKGDEESPLKKLKKAEASGEDVSSDEKLAAEMDKLMDEPGGAGEDEDDDEDDDEDGEVLVVEETQRDDTDVVLKARKKRYGVPSV